MTRILAALTLTLLWQAAAWAQGAAAVDRLYRALGLPEIVAIMRDEGVAYGDELQDDLLGGHGDAAWQRTLVGIYDLDRMQAAVRDRLETELAGVDLAPMIAFFDTPRGRRIVALEVSARRALLDDGVEAASRDALAAMIAARDPRLTLLEEFAAAGDLVEMNVAGALNANLAFYAGLEEGGAFPGGVDAEEMLADIRGQEDMIRLDTGEWLFAYLAMAYRPLEDADLKSYIAFMQSDAGTALNLAIFAAFDEMFVTLSRALGQGAARYLAAEDL